MDITYPFIPKSNSKLRPGHFWPIKLSNGQFACGIVLTIPTDKGLYNTRNFYAGLLNWTGMEKPTSDSLESAQLKILDNGVAHIKTILTQGEAIEGQIDLLKNDLEIELVVDSRVYSNSSYVLKGFQTIRKATRQDHQILKTKSTWGYEVIVIQANRLLNK
jgi:hypothetical protein